MPRKSTAQPSFFQRAVPRMPDGYYSAGPNPNLGRFVSEHAHPYDPATDDYDVPPFDQPITTTKATAIYNMHTYWSKKPHDAIRQYIAHYTQPGDIVLDPFCGSGGTALAALMEGRAAIAIDLSPAATFITKNYCTPVDVDELQRAFEELQRQVKPEMEWLYETRCDRCDGRATTAYTVYSQVFQCPRCLEKVALFDCIEVEGRTADGRPKKISVCPHCYARGLEEEISTRSERFDAIPVLVSYECEEGCKPKRGERRHNDRDPKKRQFFARYDLAKVAEIVQRRPPYWYPTARMLNAPASQERWGLLWRPYHAGVETVADFYTPRNLYALALLWDRMRYLSSKALDPLEFAFTSIVLKCSKMMAHNSDGIGRIQKGTLYIPAVIHDVNVSMFMDEAVGDMGRGYKEISLPSTDLIISTDDARQLSLPANSADYIFTDPPYSWKVQFGESNFIWEAWLRFDSSWLPNEIIVNEVRQKADLDWEHDMHRAMGECFRVLKPGRWLSLCYHDTSEGTWQLLQDLMTSIGFVPDTIDETLYIDASQKSIKQITANQVTKRDLVINFRKPRPGEVAAAVITGDEDAATFGEKARAILMDALEAHPGATGDRLYDELVSRMVRRGEFERHNFEELLAQVAEPVREAVMQNLFEARSPDLFGSHESVRWYLKETADRADEAESAREAAAAARLEAFIRGRAGQAAGDGVHYSDLFEQYLGVKEKPRRLLADWLPEYFVKTADGRWRLPADEGERAALASLRSSGALRRIKRFAHALLDGVPPAGRDRPVNLATAADWLRQCRRAGLYELGRALYEKGAFAFGELGEERGLEVEEDYQVCVRRSG